jgi:hypothetical protein
MIKKSLPGLLIIAVVAIALLSALYTAGSVSASQARTPRPTRGLGAGANNLTATVAALSNKALGTATALAATAKALTGSVPGTATAFAATAQAFSGAARGTVTAVAATATALHLQTTGADEASAAITSYALQVLGTQVTVTRAGGLSTSSLTRGLSQTPAGAAAQGEVADLALKSYAATLENGAATLSYGSGTLSGDINIDVQGASLGVYSLARETEALISTNSSLNFAKAMFPALADFQYEPYPVSTGFAWYATGAVPAIDPKNHQMITTAQTILLYVLPSSSSALVSVTATVGRGDFATAIQVP